jgi:hypothetical protein
MGKLSKRAETILDMRPSNLDCEVTTRALSDSRSDPSSLADFLRKRQLITTDDSYGMERARERIEESGVVPMMLETCDFINNIAGGTIVDVHSFLPPIPILYCFIFEENGIEYFMHLGLRGGTPTLIFAERSCRDSVSNDFVRWALRLANIDPVTITIKLMHEFQDLNVSIEQVRDWFKYLVSGMDRAHTPSFRAFVE